MVAVVSRWEVVGGGGRLKALRIARLGSVQAQIPVHIHNGDVGRVDQRIESQFSLNRLADVLGPTHVNDPFHDR
jgi:hypothetical protein